LQAHCRPLASSQRSQRSCRGTLWCRVRQQKIRFTGLSSLLKGRIEDALALGKQNLLACVGFGSLQGIVQSLSQRRYFRRAPREADAAAPLLSCFEAQREQIGVSEAWVARINEQTLAAIRARLDESAFAEAWEQGRALTIDEAVALALESLE